MICGLLVMSLVVGFIWLYSFLDQLILFFLLFPLVLSLLLFIHILCFEETSLLFFIEFLYTYIFMWVRRSMFYWEMSLETLVLMRFHVFGVFKMEIIVLKCYWVIYGCWIWFSLVYHEMFVSVLFRVTCYPLLSSTFPNVSHLNPKPTLQPFVLTCSTWSD